MSLTRLLQGIRNREEEPFRRFMADYGPRIHRMALRMTLSEATADDVLQEVLIGLPEALQRFDGRRFDAWLATVVRNRTLMSMRSESRRQSVEAEAARDRPSTRPSHEEAVLSGRTIETALPALDAQQRAVFLLKELEGLSHEEIAEALGITVGASRARLFRARQALRASLSASPTTELDR